MDDTSIAEVMEALPIKRKSPRLDRHSSSAAAGPPQPPLPGARASQRTACGPACSSPALGGWCITHSSTSSSAESRHDEAGRGAAADDCLDGNESGRGKAQRICCNEATPCDGSSDHSAAAGAGGQGAGIACPASSQHLALGNSLPPALYRSYHAGCCSRLSSSNSLSELEASTAAAGAEPSALTEPGTPASEGCTAACATAPPTPAGGWHSCRCGACTLHAAAGQAALRQQYRHVSLAGPFEQQQAQEQQAAAASPWADVPDDILKRVLERLPPSTLRVLRLVCRGWEAAANRLLRHLRPEALAGKRLGSRFPALHSLDLSNAAMGVNFATPRMLRLQSLLCDDDLAELAGLHRLEQLSLRGCSRLSGQGLRRLAPLAGSLTVLNLSNCSGFSDACMALLVASLPRLATLSLQGCCRVGDAGIAHLAGGMSELRHILLPAGVSDASMHMLAEMPALERVALRGCTRVTTTGIYLLLQRRGLQRVVISKCPQVTLESLCGEPNLKVITEAAGAAVQPSRATDTVMAAAAVPAMPGAAAGLAGQDMHLLVADV